jgi:hypothetical protein
MNVRRRKLVNVTLAVGVLALVVYALVPTTKADITGLTIGLVLMVTSILAMIVSTKLLAKEAGNNLMTWGLALWILGVVVIAIHGVEYLIAVIF